MKPERERELVETAPPPATLPPAEPDAIIELCLAPDDIRSLTRRPGLVRASAARPLRLVWLDDPEASLTAKGRIIEQTGQTWQYQPLEPGHGIEWPACSPPPGPAESEALPPPELSFETVPAGAFEGSHQVYRKGDVSIDVLDGDLRGLLLSVPTCRLRLSGPAPAIEAALPKLAELRVAVPRATLAREALAVASGAALPPRHLGTPALAADIPLSDGLSQIIGHLLDALLYWVDRYRYDAGAEAVHQGRVATRRLRSALSLYRHAVPCDDLTEAAAGLRRCAATLGAARDWDVFLTETGARLGAVAAPDRRIATLLRAARRRQLVVHAELAAFLDGSAFRQLELMLGSAASLRPWERGQDRATLAAPTGDFAAAALERRLKHVRRRGKALDELPLHALHELRKDCKRLRYAAEFFAPAFPNKAVKPFVRRLAALQEELGTLNDSAVASQLMTQLGRAGGSYAGGVIEGWASAAATPARDRIARRWKRFRAAKPFWTD